MGDTVAAQLVGHEPHGFLSLTLQQSAKESPRCTPVPTGLYEDVDQVTVLIHRAPEILALTVDRHEDFVQEPRISESTLSSLQLPSVVGAELPAPLANGFVGHDDSSFGQQILNIPEAHAVSVVEPDGMADDFGRKAMPMVAGPASVHPGIVPGGELRSRGASSRTGRAGTLWPGAAGDGRGVAGSERSRWRDPSSAAAHPAGRFGGASRQ